MKNLKTANKNRTSAPQFIRRALADTPVKCNRCNAETIVNEVEYCWFCGRMICFTCFDEFGECGHANEKHVKVRK